MDPIEEIAQRLERRADRCRATNDLAGEQIALKAAKQARASGNVREAIRIEEQFNGSGTGQGAPEPQGCLSGILGGWFRGRSVGTSSPIGRGVQWGSPSFRSGMYGGSSYSMFGNNVRTGGSQAWRDHNPGLIPFDAFAQEMGAVGSDNGIAIFPDEDAGRRALQARMRRSGGESSTVDDLVNRSYLDSSSPGNASSSDILRAAGIAPGTDANALSDAEIARLSSAIENQNSFKGEEFTKGSADAPAWVNEVSHASDNS